jgi:hypothetical protein
MKKNGTIKEIHVPKAENMRMETEPKALIKCLDKIEEARKEGECGCYLSAGREGVPKTVILKLLEANYNISYKYFEFSGDWFIKASWLDGCTGKLYNEENNKWVDIETMYTY